MARSSRSSLGILSNHSLIMLGVSLRLTSSTMASSPVSNSSCSISRKLVGFANLTLDWTIPHWGHSLNFFFFLACFTTSLFVPSLTFPKSSISF
ncbi:hypothetical protein ES707_15695 [subsurface metagenome]